MAKQFNEKTKANIGQAVRVFNIDQHPSANPKYTNVFIVSEETGEVIPYLFTDKELRRPAKRATMQPEDVPRYHRSLLKRLFFIK